MPERQSLASTSSTTDEPHCTPSPSTPSSRESDGLLYMVEGSDAYELQPVSRVDGGGARHTEAGGRGDEEDEEGDGDGDREWTAGSRRVSVSSSVQSYELYTPDEDRAVVRKLDTRLVAFMAMLYCLSFLDRSNIGNARIAGLAEDLKLSSSQYEWLLWAFYITYIAFEWMTLLYRIIPPHIYISLCILSWGIIASVQATATSFGFLLVLRALLGISEAAFGPGVPFYLSFFFRRHELAFRTGLFISASPLSASFAGGLAWLITKVGEHGPLSPWRLLFLIEGFPSVVVAVWAWKFVPDGPGVAKWLSAREKKVAVLRLRQEKEKNDEEEEEKHAYGPSGGTRRVHLREILQTLKDPKCYLTAFMFFSCNVAFSSLPVFLPTILTEMNHPPLTAQLLTAPPYLLAFLTVLLTAHLSDATQSRSPFIIAHSLLATLGYATIALCGYFRYDNTTLRYLALYPAAAGFFAAITIIITWTINNQESETGKGVSVAMMNVIGQMGPLVGTSIFPDEEGPWYVKGMAVCAGFMALVGVLAAVLRWVLVRENKRRRTGRRGGAEYEGVPLVEGGVAREAKSVFEFML